MASLVLGHTSGETHKGRSKGPFLTRIGASARVRARLALHAPTLAFGRRRLRPLADRGLRPPPQIAGSRWMLLLSPQMGTFTRSLAGLYPRVTRSLADFTHGEPAGRIATARFGASAMASFN